MNHPLPPSMVAKARLGLLTRIGLLYPVYALVTILFFAFSGDAQSLEDIFGTLAFLGFWNLILPLAMGLALFQPLARAMGDLSIQGIQTQLKRVTHRTLLMVGLIGLGYVGLITILGISTQASSYSEPWKVIEFLASMVYSYIILPVYSLNILLDSWNQNLRGSLTKTLGMAFTPGKAKFRTDLGLAFLVLAIIPMATIYISLGANGLLQTILQKNPYLFSYLIIILGGIVLNITMKARSFSIPVAILQDSVDRITQGDLTHRAPVLVDHELGQLTTKVNSMAQGLQERERMRDVFGKAVDPQVRDYLLASSDLGGSEQTLTMVFSDLRNFTTLAQSLSPQEVVSTLNRYFEKINQAIGSNHGVINKFVGDAIMAVFGLGSDSLDHGALNGIKCAEAMTKALEELNKEFATEGRPLLAHGIGIHTGTVVAGIIGSTQRLEFTLIGDAVNLASRLEGLTKELGHGVLMSETTKKALGSELGYKLTQVGTHPIKGRQGLVEVWTLG